MFDRFLSLSEALRPGFSESLGASSAERADAIRIDGQPLPPFLRAIYSRVRGTPSDIKSQTLMDFLPGYRLIHLSELEGSHETCAGIAGSRQFVPFLANYSSDFCCWRDGRIFDIAHDSPMPCLVHATEEQFYATICDFYEKSVYFLDEDGHLDYDYERERLVSCLRNPRVFRLRDCR